MQMLSHDKILIKMLFGAFSIAPRLDFRNFVRENPKYNIFDLGKTIAWSCRITIINRNDKSPRTR